LSQTKPLILPVETQVREFDAKLLLACVAAERGIPAYIGFQNRIRDRITTLPPGIFIAKGFASKKAKIMGILTGLGHEIYAWDEEGLVHQPPPIYHDRRISKKSLEYLSGLFAWGDDYKEMVEAFPHYDGTPIYCTGNPRVDLLRPEVRAFYDAAVGEIRDRFGRFILLNSSFGTSNLATGKPTERQKGTAPSVRDTKSWWQGQLAYRVELFELYREMTGKLAARFPDRTFLVRPHPAESLATWRDYAADFPNLAIEHEGNVTPWLMACDMMIHNGCMTGIEGALLGTPVIAYQPIRSEHYDRPLPNMVSRQCDTLEELYDTVDTIALGNAPPDDPEATMTSLADYLVHEKDRLSADRIVDILQDKAANGDNGVHASIGARYGAWCAAELRGLGKWLRSFRSNDIYSPWHQRQQFPELAVAQVEAKIDRFRGVLGRFKDVKAATVRKDIFLVSG
jgi:surface carbohydrate biosynthesis protein